MTDEQDREKIVMYQILQQKIKTLDSRRNLIFNRLVEVDSTISSLEEIKGKENEEIFLPLGSGVYVKGSLNVFNRMIVLIGSDIAIDINFEKARKILEDNRKILENGIKTIEDEAFKTTEELINLEPEIQQILQKRK